MFKYFVSCGRLSQSMEMWWRRFLATKRLSAPSLRWSQDGGSSTNQSPWQFLFRKAPTPKDQRQSSAARRPPYVCFVVLQVVVIQIWRNSEPIDSYVKNPVILFQEERLLPSGRTSPALHRSHLSTNVFPSPQMYQQGISISSVAPSFLHNHKGH